MAKIPANANKVVDTSGALKPLNDAMAKAAKAGDASLFNRLLSVREELRYNWKPFRTATGKVELRATGLRNVKVSPAGALEFKRIIGDRIRWTDDPIDGDVNSALAGSYTQVKDALNKAMPEEFQKLNQQYADLAGARSAIERRLPVEQRAALVSLRDMAAIATGHMVGHGGIALGTVVAEHPAIRTRGARALYRLQDRVPTSPTVRQGAGAPVVAAPQPYGRERLKQLRAEAERRKREAQQKLAAGVP